ncbi:ankyrin repeat domain-containing protein [Thiotrichales bacterium 19S9-12]|nr:ankyrin repeat domain-containing protein [Thiotrichales bacterium 19S9-11]MCF6810786.1 ankyrin repeat domain-containing protein [Thiotrichales bacterium 19S9-12]
MGNAIGSVKNFVLHDRETDQLFASLNKNLEIMEKATLQITIDSFEELLDHDTQHVLKAYDVIDNEELKTQARDNLNNLKQEILRDIKDTISARFKRKEKIEDAREFYQDICNKHQFRTKCMEPLKREEAKLEELKNTRTILDRTVDGYKSLYLFANTVISQQATEYVKYPYTKKEQRELAINSLNKLKEINDKIDALINTLQDELKARNYSKLETCVADIRELNEQLLTFLKEYSQQIIAKFEYTSFKGLLNFAVSQNNIPMTELFIDEGVNNTKNIFDRTPLHIAAREGHIGVARVLFENGATINANDQFKSTPFLSAVDSRKQGMAQYLLTCGADINHQDDSKSSALHIASLRPNIEMVRFLLDKGIDTDLLDFQKRTALSLTNSKEIRVAIEEHKNSKEDSPMIEIDEEVLAMFRSDSEESSDSHPASLSKSEVDMFASYADDDNNVTPDSKPKPENPVMPSLLHSTRSNTSSHTKEYSQVSPTD